MNSNCTGTTCAGASLHPGLGRFYGRAATVLTLGGLLVILLLSLAWALSVYFQFGITASSLIEVWRRNPFYLNEEWFIWPKTWSTTGQSFLLGMLPLALALLAGSLLRNRLSQRRQALYLAVVLLLAFAIRLLCILTVPFEPYADFAIYKQSGLLMARNWSLMIPASGVYRCFLPPGQVFTLGVLYHFLGTADFWPQLVNCLYATATVAGIWYIGRHWFGWRAGLLAALVAAMLPSTVFSCLLLGAEVPQTFWLVLGLCFYVRMGGTGKLSPALLCGLCLGIGAMFRPTYLLLPAVILVHLLLSGQSPRQAVARGLILAAGMAMVVLPWTARNYAVTGGFLPISSNGGGNLYSANNPDASGSYSNSAWVYVYGHATDDLSLNRIGMESAKKWINEHPREFAVLGVKKLTMFWETDKEIAWWATSSPRPTDARFSAYAEAFSDGYYLACIVGAAAGAWRLRRYLAANPQWSVLWVLAASFTLVHMVFESQGKYHYMLIPLLCLLVALPAVVKGDLPQSAGTTDHSDATSTSISPSVDI